MSFKDWFKWGKKSEANRMIAMQHLGRAVGTPRNYESFSKEGYQKNVVAFRAIKGVSDAAKGIPWVLFRKRKGMDAQELEGHPLLDLLHRPNPLQGQAAFMESIINFYQIAGNAYIDAVGPSPTRPPKELWPLRPDRMKVIPGANGLPQGYEYSVNNRKTKFEVNMIKGKSPILHLKTFNPVNDFYGMSPIEAATFSVDQHNEASKWNFSLLRNSTVPSGALVVQSSESNPNGQVADETFERLKTEIDEKYSGGNNAGRPMLLEGGLDWKSMAVSPKDMDWINGKNMSAREIALALGYPPILLGIQGDSTYNNQQEARLALYEETVLPLMDFIRDELNNWLTPIFGDEFYLDYDRDSISALSAKREKIWEKVQTSEFLTINEKRAATGYEPIEGGDVLFVNAGQVPLDFATDTEINEPIDDSPPPNEEPEIEDIEENDEPDEEKQVKKKDLK